MKKILSLIFFLVVIPAMVLGYLGFIPGLSHLFGSDKPRDLGVKYTQEDVKSATDKNGVVSTPIAPDTITGEPLRYEGKKEIKTSFTAAEITAINNANRYIYKPFSNVQIKISPDGTGEASGVLDVNKILTLVSFSHPVDQIKKAIADYHIGLNPPFYLKGRVSVINNKITLNPQTIEVGRVKIPESIVSQNIIPVATFIENRLNSIPNLQVRSFNLDGGTANLDATFPEKEFSAQ